MSPILSPLHKPSRLHLGPWRWSKCSAMKIKQSLGAGRGNCLYKTRLRSQNRDRSQGNTVVNVRSVVPIMIERHQEPELPISTAVLSEHKQCQLIFGRGKCSTWCGTSCVVHHGVVNHGMVYTVYNIPYSNKDVKKLLEYLFKNHMRV